MASGKKTICFYSPMAMSLFDEQTPGGHGGSELQLFKLGTAISVISGYRVHFLMRDLPERRTDGTAIQIYRIARHVPRGEGPRGISIITNLRRSYRVMATPPRDVFVLSGANLELGYAGLYTRLTGRKLVFIVASDADLDCSLMQGGWFERRMYHLGLHLSNVILCQNEWQQAMMKRTHGLTAHLLRNGLEIPAAPPKVAKKHVLWVASCQTLKQPHLFLDLAEESPSVEFVMVMPPRNEPELFDSVVARATQLRNVEFHEGVHFSDIQKYFDEALAFVNTSTVEGFPNTFVQAMASATPILSLNVDPNGILEKEELGLLAHGSMTDMADALRCLLEDSELRTSYGARALAYGQAHHDIRRIAEQFLEYLNDASA